MDEEDWLAAQAAAGRPEHMTGFLLGFYRAAQSGYFAGTDPLLGELLGREPHEAREALV